MAGRAPSLISAGDTPSTLDEKVSLEATRPSIQQSAHSYEKEAHIQNNRHGRTKKVLVRRRKKKDLSPLRMFCAWLVEHQVGLAINLMLLLFTSHILFPRARSFTSKFFHMSYYHPESNTYTEGPQDAYFVLFWTVLFTGLRAATMDYVLEPLAKLGGIHNRKGLTRFAEQGWLLIYDSSFWSLGMYIMYHSKYWLNLREMWTDFPVRALSPLMKWYYLVQFAFWLQQLVVVNIEERRKDHWQMFTHHIFTSALLLWSYGFYQTKVGNTILCIMDIVDILLPLAKLLNYLRYRTACDIAFGVFLLTWFVARHLCYLLVCWSIWAHVPSIMTYGCYRFTSIDPTVPGTLVSEESDSTIWRNIFHGYFSPEEEICFGPNIRYAFLGLLLALQVLTLIWFGMILKVAYSVVMGKGAEDSRSDAEDEEEDEQEEIEIEMPVYELLGDPAKPNLHALALDGYLEEEVGAEGLYQVRKRNTPVTRSRGRRSGGRASGISIPGHGDHKELLGRIGCDKPQ